MENKMEKISVDCDKTMFNRTLDSSATFGSFNVSDNILSILNDYCIITIFEYLPLPDLCNVADVCRVFEWNASSVFRRKYSNPDLDEFIGAEQCYCTDEGCQSSSDSDDLNTSSGSENYRWKKQNKKYKPCYNSVPECARCLQMETVKKLFRHFGVYIREIDLDVDDERQKDEILELLATFCADEETVLSTLRMTDYDVVSTDVTPRIQLLFNRLQSLYVTSGSFSTLYIGSELTELMLEDLWLKLVEGQKMEKLQTLSLIDVRECEDGALESLLSLCPHVKVLTISGRTLPKLWQLNNWPPGLQELRTDDTSLDPEFLQFQHLKRLDLDCMDSSITELLNKFVEHNVPIEELLLSNLMLTKDAATYLAKLNNLRKLSLSNGGWLECVDLASVFQQLPLLEKLYLCDFGSVTIDCIKDTIKVAPKLIELAINFQEVVRFVLRTKDFNDIGRLVAKRIDTKKLTLELTGTEVRLDVPKFVIERNSEWLDIIIITFKDVEPIDVIEFYGTSDNSDESESGSDSDHSVES